MWRDMLCLKSSLVPSLRKSCSADLLPPTNTKLREAGVFTFQTRLKCKGSSWCASAIHALHRKTWVEQTMPYTLNSMEKHLALAILSSNSIMLSDIHLQNFSENINFCGKNFYVHTDWWLGEALLFLGHDDFRSYSNHPNWRFV